MYFITKTFKFEGAHVLDSSYSVECQNIHGHSYEVNVTIGSEFLNEDDMVVDFKKLKEIVGPIINELDHALLMSQATFNKVIARCPLFLSLGWNVKTCHGNPTAENMARDFCNQIHDAVFPLGLSCIKVDVMETKTGKATYIR